MAAAREDATTSSTSAGRNRIRVAVFPLVIVAAVVLLTVLKLSGSSTSLYMTEVGFSEERAGLLDGPARGVRSDEFLVRTPWVLRQAELGLPDSVRGDVGTHDMTLLSDLPTGGWEGLLRPHSLVYRVLPVEHAFAAEWWSLYALLLVGVYCLVLTLTRRIDLAIVAAVLTTCSPAVQWWGAGATYTALGYAALAGAAFVSANRRTAGLRLLFLAGAGAAVTAFLSTLYVPWQIGMAYVCGLPVLAHVAAELRRRDRQLPRLAANVALVVVLGCLPFVSLLVVHRDAVAAISGTEYPGRQPAHGGGGIRFARAFSGTFDLAASRPAYALVNGTNQSENAAGIPFGLAAVAAMVATREGRRHLRERSGWPLAATLLTCLVLTAWQVLPIPEVLGRPLLLFRVAPKRVSVPLAAAHTLALVLTIAWVRAQRPKRPLALALPAFGVMAAILTIAAVTYEMDRMPPRFPTLAASAAVVAVLTASCFTRRPAPALAALCLLVVAQAAAIHPVQRGLAPLLDSPLRRTVDEVQRTAPPGSWVALGGGPHVKATLTAAGVPNLAGISPYPDRSAWRALDPTGDDESTWNRYAHLSFFASGPGTQARIVLEGEDSISVFVDPCGTELAALSVTVFVALDAELTGCVRLVATVPFGTGAVRFYERTGTGA